MSANSSQTKMSTPEPDKSRKDHGSPDNTSTDGTSLTSGSREDDSVAMNEDLNIFQAILLNNFEVVEHLLDTARTDYIVHIKATDSLGRTPLFLACYRGDLQVVKLILGTAAANVDPVDKNGWSPLTAAAFNGHKDIVECLLEESADMDLKENAFDWTPFLAAVWNGHVECADLLLSHGASSRVCDRHNRTAIFLAAQRNHLAMLDFLLKRDMSMLNDVDSKGRTPVHVAVQMRHKEVLQRLCSAKARVELGDHDGRKALFLAHKLGYEDIAEVLIAAGADKNQLEVELANGIGEEVRPCKGHYVAHVDMPPQVKVTAFCETGDKIWAGCGDGSLIIWDIVSRKRLVYLPKFQAKTISHVVAVDSSTVWCLSGSNDIYIWVWNSGPLASTTAGALPSSSTGATPAVGGTMAAAAGGAGATGAGAGAVGAGGANGAPGTEAPLNPHLVTNSQRLNQGTQIFPIERYGNEVYGGSSQAAIYVWNTLIPGTSRKIVLDASQLKLQEHDTYVSAMLLHNGRFYVAVKKTVAWYDMNNKLAYKGAFEGHSDTITSIVVVDEKYLWTSSRDNSIKVWNLETRECIKTFAEAGGGYIACLHRTKEDQILSGGRDGRVRSWDTKTLAWKRTFGVKHARDVSALLWDSNNRLWVSSLDKTVTIYE